MVRLAEAMKRSSGEDLKTKRRPGNAGKRRPSSEANSPGISVSPAKIYNGLIAYLEEVGVRVENGERFDIEKGARIIQFILSTPKEIREELHSLTLLAAGNSKDSLAAHAVNVAINAIIIGASLGYKRQEHADLVMAALFHEVGMYLLPGAIRNKKGKLTRGEMDIVRTHCDAAYNELLQYGEVSREVAEVVRQEHERLDGSGYPRGLQKDEIHEHASIIGVLDIYAAMVQNRSYRVRLSPSEAMKEIIRRCKGLFPTSIIKKLLSQLSVYPIRSYVRLNNDSIGMVVKTNSLWPLKPTVSLIYDAQGKRVIEGQAKVDLAENPLLYVKDVLSEKDFSYPN